VGLAVYLAASRWEYALGSLLCLVAALGAAGFGLVRRRVARVLGLSAAALFAAASLILFVDEDMPERVAVFAALWFGLGSAAAAFAIHVRLPPSARPQRPVLFLNPHSGGGKAERFQLAKEARARSIEPVELQPGADLKRLVDEAVAAGADALGMAGGDGSQAVVASIAAQRGLPYTCIPAGTRNHFALDLGVDRDDVVGALDAFVDGGERRVDLAEVNGRVFVNNVSLGVYAEAVQRSGYRDAKLRTILDTMPDVIGPQAQTAALRWVSPSGQAHRSGAVLLISNNPYRLGRVMGTGTRPRLDTGTLGVAVLEAPLSPRHEWAAPEFVVESDGPVPAGIDGEAVVLEAPVRFRVRPGTLRVRIAPSHPGVSPSALHPATVLDGAQKLLAIAAGRSPAMH
jgi:diacylglycerol kinase family enzyme